MEQLRYKRHDNPPVNLITIYDCGCSGYSSLEIVVKTAARWRFLGFNERIALFIFSFFFSPRLLLLRTINCELAMVAEMGL